MNDIAAIAARVTAITGTTAIALALSASAAFAQGDVATGRARAEAALSLADGIGADGIIEGELRAELRTASAAVSTEIDPATRRIISKLRAEADAEGTSEQRRETIATAIDVLTRDRRVASAARDLAAAAGMASRGNPDFANVVRSSLAAVDDSLDGDQRWAVMKREIGLPIRLDDPSHRTHFEAL